MSNVDHPNHYANGSIECIDAIESALTQEEFEGFLHGNILKYDWRYRNKNGIEDLKKSQWYNNKLQTAIAKRNAFNRHQSINTCKKQQKQNKRAFAISSINTCMYATGEFPRVNDTVQGNDGKIWFVVDVNINNYPYVVTAIDGEWIASSIDDVTVNNPAVLNTNKQELKACWLIKKPHLYPYGYLKVGTGQLNVHYSLEQS